LPIPWHSQLDLSELSLNPLAAFAAYVPAGIPYRFTLQGPLQQLFGQSPQHGPKIIGAFDLPQQLA
jgi:hypothetical protein